MNIPRKLSLAAAIIFLSFLVLLNFVSTSILMKGFYGIEHQDTVNNVERVRAALLNELNRMHKFTGDYSMWDATCAFMGTGDAEYIASNLNSSTFTNAKVNVLVYMRLSGESLYAKRFNLITGKEEALSGDIVRAFNAIGKSAPADPAGNYPKGFLFVGGEIMLAAARPIVTSTGEGPSRGLLFTARVFDAELRNELEKLTRLSFKIYPNNGIRAPNSLSGGESIAVRQESEDRVSGSTALEDVFGRPSLVLQVDQPRTIYHQGLASRNYLMLISLALFALFSIAFFIIYHKLISQQIARSDTETRFSRIAEATPDAVILTSQTGHIVFWNKAAEEMFGYAGAEIIGQPWYRLLHESSLESGGENSAIEKNNGHSRDDFTEFTACRKDGSQFPAEASFARWRQSSERYFGAIVRDISERKRTMEELLRSNSDLEQFAYIASHDLQEPLRQVYSMAQLLRERYGSSLDGKACDYLHFIIDGAGHMSNLVHDLLTYSRLSTVTTAQQAASCQSALDQAVANLSMSIEETHAGITHDELPAVMVKPAYLTQLFQNLIGNAIKFRSADAAPRIHVGVRPDGDNWLFRITDNGIGIDPMYYEKIFLIFQRLHGRRNYPGTGIGLAICKRIVEQHGGEIRVESQEGRGATFFFTLPKTGVHHE